MKKLINILLVLVISSFVSTSYAASLKWSMPGDSLTLDPHAQNEGPTHMVSRQVYEGLVTPGINMEILPQLAESWETTADDTWVFNIRKGVKFHDGSSLTASDIAFSINRAKTAPSDMVDLIKSIKSASAIDDHTVQIKTDGPNPILLNQLTQIFVMSEAWAKANGCEVSYNWDAGETSYCASNANGSGPFKITFREQDVRTVFEKNDDWWGDDSTFNVDKVELLPIKNDATRVAALLSGEIDYTNVVPVQDIARIKSSSSHDVKMTPQNRTIFFGMDQGSAELNSSNIKGKNPFADKRVRLAMYHALDMDAIKDKVMRGQSVPNPDIPHLKPMSKKDIEIQWLYSHIDEYNHTFRDAPIEDIETHVGLRADAYGFVAQCFIEIDTKMKIRYKKFLELKNKLFEAAGDKYQGVAPKKVNDLENQLKKKY